MEKSTSIKHIATALQLFHIKVGKIGKDSRNPFFNSAYCSLSNILENIAIPLQESGLAFSQLPYGDGGLVTILMHCESGEYLQSEYRLQPSKNDPQSVGGAITYARRYALAAILGLNIDEDDDGNRASGKTVVNKQAAPPKKEGEKELPWLNMTDKDGVITEQWQKVEAALQTGKYTVDDVRKKYRVSKTVLEQLKMIVPNEKQSA